MAVAFGVFVSRLPFLSATSYGLDNDAWRMAASGALLVETGEYVASRMPGYPVPEAVSALAWALGGGPWLFGALTALASAAAAGAFFLLLRALGRTLGVAALGAFAFAFVPVVYVESVGAMDYVWALAPAVGALAAGAHGRSWTSGLLLGLAVGARLTSVVIGVPVAGLLLAASTGRADALRRIGTLVLASAGVAALLWLPVLHTYGPATFFFVESDVGLRLALQRATLEIWGLLGLAGLALGLAGPFRPLDRRSAGQVAALGAGLAAVAALFARLPLEAGYLLPAVPLTLAGLALVLPRRRFVVVCAGCLIAPFAFDLDSAPVLPPTVRPVVHLGERAALTLQGPLWIGAARQREDGARALRLAEVADRLPATDVLVVGGDLSRIAVTSLRTRGRLPAVALRHGSAPSPLRYADQAFERPYSDPPARVHHLTP